jgi:hypothetical protein
LDEFEININEKFVDYETAIIEIENCLPQLANNSDEVESTENTVVVDDSVFISA